MNTKKLLKQCQAMQRKQEAARQLAANPSPTTPPPPVPGKQIITEVREEVHMTPIQLEQYLTNFLQMAREAERRYEEAIALEQLPNDILQDYLHQLEFAPEVLTMPAETLQRLSEVRRLRRTAKKELEVTQIWKNWAEENKQALNKLEQAVGAMRKVINRQPNDYYFYKSNEIGEKGSVMMQGEEPEEPQDPQISIYEYIEGAAL